MDHPRPRTHAVACGRPPAGGVHSPVLGQPPASWSLASAATCRSASRLLAWRLASWPALTLCRAPAGLPAPRLRTRLPARRPAVPRPAAPSACSAGCLPNPIVCFWSCPGLRRLARLTAAAAAAPLCRSRSELACPDAVPRTGWPSCACELACPRAALCSCRCSAGCLPNRLSASGAALGCTASRAGRQLLQLRRRSREFAIPACPAACARLPSLCRAPDCRPCSAVFPREPACPAARAPPFTRCLVRLSRCLSLSSALHFCSSSKAFAHVWRQGKHCFHGKKLTLDVPGP